jgi:hypothetical protein
MKKLIEKIKNKLWPIGLQSRVVAGQFTAPAGASMLLYSQESRLEFRFKALSAGLGWVENLHMSITRGDLKLVNSVTDKEVPLNRRERLLIGEAVACWLSLDNISGQVEVVK